MKRFTIDPSLVSRLKKQIEYNKGDLKKRKLAGLISDEDYLIYDYFKDFSINGKGELIYLKTKNPENVEKNIRYARKILNQVADYLVEQNSRLNDEEHPLSPHNLSILRLAIHQKTHSAEEYIKDFLKLPVSSIDPPDRERIAMLNNTVLHKIDRLLESYRENEGDMHEDRGPHDEPWK